MLRLRIEPNERSGHSSEACGVVLCCGACPAAFPLGRPTWQHVHASDTPHAAASCPAGRHLPHQSRWMHERALAAVQSLSMGVVS
jgi:hypothetical protein